MNELTRAAVKKAGNKSQSIMFNIHIENREEEGLKQIERFAEDYQIRHALGTPE
jgi:hypothetical protein